MKRLTILTVFFMLAAVGGVSSSPAADIVGHIRTLTGAGEVLRGDASEPAALGTALQMNDTLKTGEGAAMGVTFIDNTRISIGPDTEYTIDAYVYNPKEKKLGFVSRITRGTLHFVSGNMAKLNPASVSVKTPEGTIGIRGTRFVVKVEGDR